MILGRNTVKINKLTLGRKTEGFLFIPRQNTIEGKGIITHR